MSKYVASYVVPCSSLLVTRCILTRPSFARRSRVGCGIETEKPPSGDVKVFQASASRGRAGAAAWGVPIAARGAGAPAAQAVREQAQTRDSAATVRELTQQR